MACYSLLLASEFMKLESQIYRKPKVWFGKSPVEKIKSTIPGVAYKVLHPAPVVSPAPSLLLAYCELPQLPDLPLISLVWSILISLPGTSLFLCLARFKSQGEVQDPVEPLPPP